MPYKDIEKHRANSRERYWGPKRKHIKRLQYKRYHQKIGTWTARRLGLTKKEYDAIVRKHGGRCAICRRRERIRHERTGKRSRLTLDHCHKTNVIRGVLCRTCNTAVAFLHEDPKLLRRAIRYLEKRH